MKVSVTDAKNKLPELERPQFGTLKGKVIIHDSDWWRPLTDQELDAFLDGRL